MTRFSSRTYSYGYHISPTTLTQKGTDLEGKIVPFRSTADGTRAKVRADGKSVRSRYLGAAGRFVDSELAPYWLRKSTGTDSSM